MTAHRSKPLTITIGRDYAHRVDVVVAPDDDLPAPFDPADHVFISTLVRGSDVVPFDSVTVDDADWEADRILKALFALDAATTVESLVEGLWSFEVHSTTTGGKVVDWLSGPVVVRFPS